MPTGSIATPPEARLPTHLEVAALRRAAEAAGGHAMVLSKGAEQGGTLLVVVREKASPAKVFERMPQADGGHGWHCAKEQDIDNTSVFDDYLLRRAAQDPDLWIIELDNANGERLVASL